MIENIFVNNLGSLRKFSNRDVPFLKGNIIIHGVNGSGKSQLSSILKKIWKIRIANQLGQSHLDNTKKEVADYLIKRKSKESSNDDNIEVKIDGFNLNVIDSKIIFSGDIPEIFVFNEEYVLENVGDKINLPDKVIRIGERNQEKDKLQKEIKKLQKAKKKVSEKIEELVSKTRNDSGFPKQTRTIKIINTSNYLSEKNPGIENRKAREQLDKLSNPPEQINFLLRIQKPAFRFDEAEQDEIENIFQNRYIEPKLTQEFYSNFLKSNKQFYEVGVDLFKNDKKQCPFCLTPKNENDFKIRELIEYIDSTYNEKLKTVKEYYSKLESLQNKINSFVDQWNSHVSAINEKASLLALNQKIHKLEFPVKKYEKYLDIIQKKIEDMSLINEDVNVKESVCLLICDCLDEFNNDYEKHTQLIKEINTAIEKLSSKKKTLGEKVIKHHMYEMWKNESLRNRYYELVEEIDYLSEQYSELSNTTSNDRIIDFFNQIIKFLGISKYKLSDSSSITLKIDNDYDISQEGFRISTGERKFIAMSYFFAEVLASVENSADLKDITIIIDDPVDSSDYQKFYSFVSVIENFNNILKAIYENDDIEFGQLIILTHNALLYERLINSNSVKEFQLNIENNTTKIVRPKKNVSLTTFSSYLKKVTNCIKRMDRSNSKDIGNYIRRVLEIIASIENVENNTIKNLNASSKLNAIANHLSHESLERILDPLPQTHEYVDACIQLIEQIKERIPNLYCTIINNYLNNKEIEEYREEYNQLYEQ